MNEQRKKCLMEIMKLDFALQDSSLFLDLRPKDPAALAYYQRYLCLYDEKKSAYEGEYGPLSNRSLDAFAYCKYACEPFPWERGQ